MKYLEIHVEGGHEPLEPLINLLEEIKREFVRVQKEMIPYFRDFEAELEKAISDPGHRSPEELAGLVTKARKLSDLYKTLFQEIQSNELLRENTWVSVSANKLEEKLPTLLNE